MTSLPTPGYHLMPAGVESSVYWGSLAGLLASALIAGLAYAGVLTPSTAIVPVGVKPIMIGFLCVVGLRYYTSIVFQSYHGSTHAVITGWPKRRRRMLFAAQTFQILGTSLNLALLTSVGPGSSALVVLLQASSTGAYWLWMWRDTERTFRLVVAFEEFLIVALGVLIVLGQAAVFVPGTQGEGAILAMIGFGFAVEVINQYWGAMLSFFKMTAKQLA